MPYTDSMPEYRFKTVSLSALKLKLIAFGCMLVDHAAEALPFFWTPQMQGVYLLMRAVGRLAFPVFAFFIAVGATKTRSMGKYLLRLGILTLLCEVPYDLMWAGRFPDWRYQNTCLILFLGLLGIAGYRLMRRYEGKGEVLYILAGGGLMLAALAGANLLRGDYDMPGVLLILGFYLGLTDLKEVKAYPFFLMLVMGALWFQNPLQLVSLLAFFLIFLYNDKLAGGGPKYLFYAGYLGQLMVFGFLRVLLARG